jgi:hypothetical protein
MFKYNNGNGAVICEKCRVIIDSHLSYSDYLEYYDPKKKDICVNCKEKEEKKKKDKFEEINDGWRNK